MNTVGIVTTWLISLSVGLCAAERPSSVANHYPGDRGIETDPRVILSTDFETDDWKDSWSGGERKTVSIVEPLKVDALHSLSNRVLRIDTPEGEHYGATLQFDFQDALGHEPEEIYFRYYIRLGAGWDPELGGKFPGIGGTYGRAGWGGRPSDGRNGWSARGLFKGRREERTEIGFYCYHADMTGTYGSEWVWRNEKFKGLENSRWYCIEQYVKMNTPGDRDGILRGWVDGDLIFEKSDVRMRDTPDLKIETIWVNIYHGGSWTAASDSFVLVDNIVIGSEYIGPLRP